MKKVIIIAMLLTVLCVCAVSTGVCFADETTTDTNEWYYFEKSSDRPNLPLRESNDDESKVLLYIPHTYAFQKIEEPNGVFVKVKYNDKEGYINTAYFKSNCKPLTSKWGDNPYVLDLSDLAVTTDDVITYDLETMEADDYPTRKSDFHINTVYGYYMKGSDYYFLVDAAITYRGESKNYTLYLKATDTNKANFKEEDIPDSQGYKLQTTPEKPQVSSGEINSGDTTTPSADKNGSDTQAPKNSLDRYILIAVIAVLCVVIMILIFAPTRKRHS